MDTFYNWPDAVKFLHAMISRNQPVAGQGIAVESTATGQRINATSVESNGNGTAKYLGAFKLLNMSDDNGLMLGVVDGDNDNPENCGFVSIGGQLIDVPVFVDVPVDDGYVVLTIDAEDGDDAGSPIYSAEITLEDEIPVEHVGNVWSRIIVLGSYSITDSNEDKTPSLTVYQAWLSSNIYVTDRVV